MSVEDAKKNEFEALGDLIDVVVDQGTESSRRFKDAWHEHEAALDRLILETRAEMPCYDYADTCLDHEAERAERYSIYAEDLLCPSCKARASLAEQTLSESKISGLA